MKDDRVGISREHPHDATRAMLLEVGFLFEAYGPILLLDQSAEVFTCSPGNRFRVDGEISWSPRPRNTNL